MRGLHLPTFLRDRFAEHPELRAKVTAHFGLSDWKVSQWMASTAKPDPATRAKVMDYMVLWIRRKQGDGLA